MQFVTNIEGQLNEGETGCKVNVVAFLILTASLLTAAEAVWEISSLSVTDSIET